MKLTQKELTDLLDLASRQYYNGQPSKLTDTEFDILLKELQEMEYKNSVIYPNSPTMRVGSDIQEGFKKGEHPKPMFTIKNAYNDDEVIAWVKKMTKDYGVHVFNVSIKYDGISCELHYKDGVLVQALTRGDKLIGDDITENVKTIKNIPLTLANDRVYKHDFYVRGEILLPKSKLNALNEERIANGEVPFANTRNACSGSIKQLDPKVTAKRGLIFKAWDCFGDVEIGSMTAKMSILESEGFSYKQIERPYSIVGGDDPKFVAENVKYQKAFADSAKFDFDYDGIVIKVDDIATQDKIGTKDTRAIDWAIARKWNEEFVVQTKLLGVDWQVGRTGVLTPVGRLEPVECGGVVISNVTLNNMDFINSFGLCIGDTLKITRSGGVIPYVLDAEHNGDANVAITEPQMCPECGSPVIRDGALMKCTNEHCPAVEKGKILQFCSKDCMDIRSIGESVVNDLYERGLVTDVSDLYKLKLVSINSLVHQLGDGYGKRKVEKMLDEIEKSKKRSWERVLAGLSIPGVGKVVARALAKEYSFCDLMVITKEELMKTEGIGEKMSEDIVDWFENENNRTIGLALKDSGVEMENAPLEHEETDGGTPLTGLQVCFTGSSNRFKGNAVEDFLEKNGAKCVHSVSKKLNYLITGDVPGGQKVAKAKELGVEVIGEDDFYKKFNLL